MTEDVAKGADVRAEGGDYETIESDEGGQPTFAFEVQHFNYKLLNSGSMSSFF